MTLLRILLVPVSWLYGGVVCLRNACYDLGLLQIESVPAKVVSVGNITAGGTGKTPVVESIVRHFLGLKARVAVISRGYRRLSRGTVVVSDGRTILSTPEASGDEPFQIARKFPEAVVVVDEKRVRGARHAVSNYRAEVIILDDGFQHRSLRRDLEIVLIDVEQPLFPSWMLPAGLRREPVGSLKRADVVVLTRWTEEKGNPIREGLNRITSSEQLNVVFVPTGLVRLSDGMRQPLAKIKGSTCVAFCGVARPASFKRMLEQVGLTVRKFQEFPDHHRYSGTDLERLKKIIGVVNPDVVLTTEKDSVRLLHDEGKSFSAQFPLYYVEEEAQMQDAARFSRLLNKVQNSG